jgi:hypothetical protein
MLPSFFIFCARGFNVANVRPRRATTTEFDESKPLRAQKLCEGNLAASMSLLVNDTVQNVAGGDEQNVVDVSFRQRYSLVYRFLPSSAVSIPNQMRPAFHDVKFCRSSLDF